MFFYNDSKPGKGVEKRDPNKSRILVFFDILPGKLWKLCKLNVLYLFSIIPTYIITMVVMGCISAPIINALSGLFEDSSFFSSNIWFDLIIRGILAFLFTVFWGQGPTTAGFTYITCEYSKEQHCWLFSDFFEKLKMHFKKSLLLWLIDLFVFWLLSIAFMICVKLNMLVLACTIFIMFFVYTIMHPYLYSIMITAKLSLWKIFKLSLVLAFGKPLLNLSISFFILLVHIVLPVAIVLRFSTPLAIALALLFEILISPALTSFTINFSTYPTINKYTNFEKTPGIE